MDRRGRVYGEHQGLPGYTIGQRKGLGVKGTGQAMYVLELDTERNTLVIGGADELGRTSLIAQDVNWTLDRPVAPGTPARCMIRYTAQPAPCTLHPLDNDRVEVRFQEPLRDIAPGQGAVFYDGDLCLGGGVIAQ
jgi:tRNA-specific 2-thiouridylase